MALQYPKGSLAAQPVRQIPSSKRRGTAASDAPMRQVMSDMQSGRGLTMPPMSQMPGGGQTRQDRIIAARMDGSFDTKRNQFNTANAGKLVMDEAGNIAPGTTSAPAAVNLVPAANPVSAPTAPPASPPIAKLPAGGSSPLMKPVGKIDGRPASLVLEGMKSGSPSPSLPASPSSSTGLRPPVTRTASGELVQPGATINPNARWNKPAIPSAVTPPMAAQAPAVAPLPSAAPASSPTPSRVMPPNVVKPKYGDNWKADPTAEKKAKAEADDYEYETKIAPPIQRYKDQQDKRQREKDRARSRALNDLAGGLYTAAVGIGDAAANPATTPRVSINTNGMPTYHHSKPGGSRGVYDADGRWTGSKTRDDQGNEVFIGGQGSHSVEETVPGSPPPGTIHYANPLPIIPRAVVPSRIPQIALGR